MKNSEIYKHCETYCKLKKTSKIDIDNICIEEMIKNNIKGFHFVFNGYIYEIYEDNHNESNLVVFIRISKAIKTMVRKTKIELLLNE